MLRVLHGLEAGHITLGLIFLILLVFVATPLLKHAMFKRSKGGSAFNPHRNDQWTPAQMREARQLLKQNERKKAEGGRRGAPEEE
jgi:hypothetical protein